MFRGVVRLCCYKVPAHARVGIFPLHLDPPTVQHRELFRLLTGDTNPDASVSSNIRGNNNNNNNNNHATSLWYFEPVVESLRKSERVPFEHLILVPNTRFPVALRLSTHLAALTMLATRGLPRVHVDFTALEHPDEDMPCVYELTQKYKNSTLVHWLQDAHEMQKWSHFGDVRLQVPLLLLQTVSIPVCTVGKPRDPRLIERTFCSAGGVSPAPIGIPPMRSAPSLQHGVVRKKDHQQQQQQQHALKQHSQQNMDATVLTSGGRSSTRRPPYWVDEGRGEEEVELSRSYQSSSTASWLSSSDDTPVVLGISDDDHDGVIPGASSNIGASGIASEGSNFTQTGRSGNDKSSTDKGTVHEDNHEDFSDIQLSAEDGSNEDSSLNEAVPARRKIRQLVEELFSTSPVEAEDVVFSQNGLPPCVEVHTVYRCTGVDVRQALWEREVDPSLLLSEPVRRYINSHGLYYDYRKDAFPKVTHMLHNTGSNGNRSGSGSSSTWRKGKIPFIGFTATLSFPGLMPRLELHYDESNLLAREHYEKLSVFRALDGEEPDLIVPIGGDGYMMHCIRNNWRRFIPFFGVNAGHVGYLLNDSSTLEELFSAPLKLHTTTMLYCLTEKETKTGEKELRSELAFNDAWVERSSGQTALIRILVNSEERIRLLRGDGVLVATAAGSTAYCQALGASPVPVGAPLIQIVGSNVVSPAQWRPTHLNQEDQVELEVIDSFKRPCRCFVDSVDMGNVTRMLVRSSRAAGVAIAFAASCDLQQKLYQMQFPKSM